MYALSFSLMFVYNLLGRERVPRNNTERNAERKWRSHLFFIEPIRQDKSHPKEAIPHEWIPEGDNRYFNSLKINFWMTNYIDKEIERAIKPLSAKEEHHVL